MLDQIKAAPAGAIQSTQSVVNSNVNSKDVLAQLPQGEKFLDFLNRAESVAKDQPKVGSLDGLKFSQHSVERMMSRGINLNPQQVDMLNQGVEKARQKGAKDSLVLMGDSAFIVSVKNNTVVTMMDKAQMQNNVFTNIDSTVVL